MGKEAAQQPLHIKRLQFLFCIQSHPHSSVPRLGEMNRVAKFKIFRSMMKIGPPLDTFSLYCDVGYVGNAKEEEEEITTLCVLIRCTHMLLYSWYYIVWMAIDECFIIFFSQEYNAFF